MDEFDDHYTEEGGVDEYAVASYEHLVFLIDAGKGMLAKSGLEGVENVKVREMGFLPEDTFMDVALKSLKELMKQHIIGNPKNKMAICFYDAGIANNKAGHEAIHIFQGMEELYAARIQAVEDLQGPAFEEEIGTSANAAANSLQEALWQASAFFSDAPARAGKRVIIFTTQDDPAGDDESIREKVLGRAQVLRQSKVEVELFNLTAEGQVFSMEFWGRIIGDPEDDLAGLAPDVQPMRIQDIKANIRIRTYKKRAAASLLWRLGGIEMGVKLYTLISKAGSSKNINVDRNTNEPLRSSGAYICKDTGTRLDVIGKFYYPKCSTTTTPFSRFPRVIFTTEQRTAMRGNFTPGMKLVGFKNNARLKMYDQLRPSTFLYPDEATVSGSAKAFIALHDQLLKKGKYALCQVVRTASSEPRLVAVLPQEELIDEDTKEQIMPPGFNIIWLPFSDDLRHPEFDNNFLGSDRPQGADEMQIAAASAMLKKLRLPDFIPGTVPNPHLQRHYQVIEALAFDREPPEFGEKDDSTMPDNQGMEAAALKEIIAFRDSIYGEGLDGKAQPKKRKATDDAPIDWQEMAKKGTLGDLTLGPLKAYCQRNHLPSSGRKDDIVKRIMGHLIS